MPPLGEIDLNVVQRTPTTVTAPDFLKPKPKRGPKKLRLVDRLYTAPKPITRIERSYSPRTRDSVLMFLIHHRIYDPGHRKSIGGYRNPSQDEASKMFQIPMLTITTWWRKRDEETFKKAARRLKKPITTGWFRRVSREIFRELYPSHVGVFTFSNGWYIGFKMRNSLVRRRITKQATSFLRFIRRMTFRPKTIPTRDRVMTIDDLCVPTPDEDDREFDLESTMNMDETPIPFEYTQGNCKQFRVPHLEADIPPVGEGEDADMRRIKLPEDFSRDPPEPTSRDRLLQSSGGLKKAGI
ncbi:hypothetical protein E4U47_003971 [Claviceps purpurea]|nr:hypothetical protein E4U47_003971 [Claviceps purpurea]